MNYALVYAAGCATGFVLFLLALRLNSYLDAKDAKDLTSFDRKMDRLGEVYRRRHLPD